MARPKKMRVICACPKVTRFLPLPQTTDAAVSLTADELEVVRLHDLERLDQQTVASQMLISRPTVAALLASARAKLADAVTNGKPLQIQDGKCTVCEIGRQCPVRQQGLPCSKRHRCGAFCRKNKETQISESK